MRILRKRGKIKLEHERNNLAVYYTDLKSRGVYDKHIKEGAEYLASLFQNQVFPCTVSSELGKFSGRGRKDECCPYATLMQEGGKLL